MKESEKGLLIAIPFAGFMFGLWQKSLEAGFFFCGTVLVIMSLILYFHETKKDLQ